MKTLFLLVLLSRYDAGDINASFVNTETLAQCQQKEALVKGIFSSAGIPVVESRCIPGELRFSEFGHSSTTRVMRHFYLIRFDREAVEIRTMPDWKSCMMGQEQSGAEVRFYCSSSVQSLIE